ncbi:MAG: STAS domain-containing protein [Thermoguttaceae bacterium]
MALIQTHSDGKVLTIYLAQTKIVDNLAIEQMYEAIKAALDKGEEPNILIDFRQVKFFSSAALGMLIRVHKRCKEFRLGLKLCNIAPDIRQVFKITGLQKLFEIHPDAADAVAAFDQKGRSARGR